MGLAQKKSVRVLGVVLAVLLLAVLAVKIFLPTEKIRDLALDQARAKLGRQVTVGEVAVSLKGGLGVSLGDFAVHNPDGFGGEHLLNTEALDLKLAIKPLFKGEIRVDRLVIDAPVVNLVRRADGTDNFTFQPNKTSGPGTSSTTTAATKAPPPLSVASLTVNDGLVKYADESADEESFREIQLAGLAIGLSLTDSVPDQYRVTGRLTADRITMTGPAQVPELDGTVDFDLIWDNAASRLSIVRAEGQVLDMPLTATGEVALAGDHPAARIMLRAADLPLVDLAALAPPELAEKISGSRDSGIVNAEVELDLPGLEGAALNTSGKIMARDVDLALAQPFLPPDQPGRLTGRGDLELDFEHPGGDDPQLKYNGTCTVRGASFTQTKLVDELQELDAELEFTPDQIIIKSSQAKFASGTFIMRGTLDDPLPYFLPPELQEGVPMKTPHLKFAMRSPLLDVDRLLPAASPTGNPAGSGATGAVSARIEREFPDIHCDGTFKADSLIYMKVPFTEVLGTVKLRDRVLSFNEVKGQVYRGTVDGQVDVDLKDLNQPVYGGSYQARGIEVNDFLTRFSGLTGVVFGGCNMQGSFLAKGRDPEAIRNSLTMDSDAGVKEGRVITTGQVHQALNLLATQGGQTLPAEQTLRDLATHISVENGRVGLDALTTRLGQFGDLTVDGYYGFNGDLNYTGSILLTEGQTNSLFSNGVLKDLARLLGTQKPQRLELPLTVGGTRTNPKVKLDLKAVTSDLQQRAVKEQGRKLEDEAKDQLKDLLNRWK